MPDAPCVICKDRPGNSVNGASGYSQRLGRDVIFSVCDKCLGHPNHVSTIVGGMLTRYDRTGDTDHLGW